MSAAGLGDGAECVERVEDGGGSEVDVCVRLCVRVSCVRVYVCVYVCATCLYMHVMNVCDCFMCITVYALCHVHAYMPLCAMCMFVCMCVPCTRLHKTITRVNRQTL